MNNKPIQLTEQDLHMLVEDAVMTYLIQEGINEDFFGGMKSLGQRAYNKFMNKGNYQNNNQQQTAQPQGNFFNRMGQRINNFGNSLSNAQKTFQMGSANGDAQKAITNALNALTALQNASDRQQAAGGNGLQGQAKVAVANAIKALQVSGTQGDPRRQFQNSADAASNGGTFQGWN